MTGILGCLMMSKNILQCRFAAVLRQGQQGLEMFTKMFNTYKPR